MHIFDVLMHILEAVFIHIMYTFLSLHAVFMHMGEFVKCVYVKTLKAAVTDPSVSGGPDCGHSVRSRRRTPILMPSRRMLTITGSYV